MDICMDILIINILRITAKQVGSQLPSYITKICNHNGIGISKSRMHYVAQLLCSLSLPKCLVCIQHQKISDKTCKYSIRLFGNLVGICYQAKLQELLKIIMLKYENDAYGLTCKTYSQLASQLHMHCMQLQVRFNLSVLIECFKGLQILMHDIGIAIN